MEKKIYLLICSCFFITGYVLGMVCTEYNHEPTVKTITEISENTVIRTVSVPKVIKVDVVKEVERIPEMELSEADKILIAKLIYAEAGNQDYIGKRLVADVVLNRLNSDEFPSTVPGVIYAPGQFAHPASSYTDDCLAAVEAECMERLDYEILYFRINNYHKIGEPAYQHGAHYFNY